MADRDAAPADRFPSVRMRLFLLGYALLWAAALPLVLLYLLWRSRRDPLYRRHIAERFGIYRAHSGETVWVHAVSLGEMRSAGPLIKELLERGETVVTTHFTPAGRKAANALFPSEAANGRLIALYVPFEYDWAYRRFFRRFRPKYGLVMEIEMWPRMIASARTCRVPLFMCNGQYPEKSFERDTGRTALRGELARGFAGLMIKSETHAARFRALGATNIAVTGELRFDQPIPPRLLTAAKAFSKSADLTGRPVVCTASSVQGEDEQYRAAYKQVQDRAAQAGLPKPLFIHVPRAPERFALVGDMLASAGQTVLRRSQVLDADLALRSGFDAAQADILLGDSLGEMYFYLALSDITVVGGGFVPKGAHNVIEPLALQKPVLVGPHIWTIEYPAVEAMAAGVLTKVDTIGELADALFGRLYEKQAGEAKLRLKQFYEEHSGAAKRTLEALPKLIEGSAYDH